MSKVVDVSKYSEQYPRDGFWDFKDVNECRMWRALSELAQRNNVRVKIINFNEEFEVKNGALEGVIVTVKGRSVIFIDDNIPNASKFEVLAHELAHYQLHNNKPSCRFKFAKYLSDEHYRCAIEAEADAFAERLIRYVRYKLNLRGIRSGSAALKAAA